MTITLNGTTGITSTVITETSGGDVGIGTSSPSGKLHVAGGASNVNLYLSNDSYSSYYYQNTGGSSGVTFPASQAYIWDSGGTERMRIDSAGRVTMPYQPVFSGNRVGLSQIINVAGPISFTPVVNQGSHWNTSTNTFTCPVAGKYFVSFYNLTNGSATTSASSVFINRNGSGVFNAYTEGGTSTSGNNYWNSSTSGVLDCQASDTITFDLSTGVAYSGFYAGATVYLIG